MKYTYPMEDTTVPAPRPRRRRWGDRYDGRRIRSLNPFYQISPYIMRTRSDSQDYFEERIGIGPAEAWLKQVKAAGRTDIGFLQLFMAAIVRTISQKPRLNRFVAGQKIYARNEILISLALKKRLHEDSPETTVKLRFQPTDTIYEVATAINSAVSENKDLDASNQTDKTAGLFMLAPGFLVRILFWIIRGLDFHGRLPKALHRASPFHASAFVTDLGSLGIKPIYHHLYDLGTVSLFLAFGGKERIWEADGDGEARHRKFIEIKIVNDERICDGHYYASAFKYMLSLLRDPAQLERPPERIVEDAD
jgi:hypothetical protein